MRDKKREAGKYNRKIQIIAPPTGQDAEYGTPTGDWVVVCTPWAWIQDELPSKETKRESNDGGIRVGERPTRIRIRWRSDITADMRIVLTDRGNRLLKIVSGPAEFENRWGLEMMAVNFSTEGDAA